MSEFWDKFTEIFGKAREDVENLAVATFGAVGDGRDDMFAPPAKPVTVVCWHCDDVYGSDEMRHEYRPDYQGGMKKMDEAIRPLWWCRNQYCDGKGFGHDIWTTRKRRKPLVLP